jgi:hypothetical protein
MNEYTYKAKKLEDGEWTSGSLFHGINRCLILKGINIKDMVVNGAEVDRDTLCRYAKGDLWENDIILLAGRVGVLRYGLHEDGFGFYVEWKRTADFDTKEELRTAVWDYINDVICIGNTIDSDVDEILKKVEELASSGLEKKEES